ncbi:MAG: 4'-phosphopantetheinyl transferase superfamily protein [Flavobacteriaceae bacterium]|jgi:4'-phosphopantetheinyl transferase EntD|nr:4'-phosphopantetheinyl transferase superfamily protein [Flavobacteriaceae bacterium]
MGLLKIIENIHSKVYVWRIDEEFEYLLDGLVLREQTQDRLDRMKSEVHKRGFLAIRHLLLVAGYTDLDLLYDSNGKPYLKDGKHISISHSFEYACLIISNYTVGIDIEQKREKIQRIANKFLNGKEVSISNSLKGEQSIEYLTRVWCAKETLFKMGDSRSLSFKDDMYIELEQFDSLCGKGKIESGSFYLEVTIEVIDLDGFILAYAVAL